MDSIRIDTGAKRIAINDDPERVITFNPSDVLFVERFYKIVGEFEAKLHEYETRYAALPVVENSGIPVADAHLALLRETCEYVREKIDYVFGAGTSQIVFGDSMVLNAFEQFFDGVTPFIQNTRVEKVRQYLPPAPPKRPRKRTK